MTKFNTNKVLQLILIGIGAGLINGMFGAGAGLLLVPMIKFVARIEDKKTHATTLACVLFMCLASSVVFFINKEYDFITIIPCLIGSLIGAVAGTFLLQKFKNKVINLIFSFVLIVAGVMMIVL